MTPVFSFSRSKCLVLWKERERITVCPTGLGVRRALQAMALKTDLLPGASSVGIAQAPESSR